MKYIYIRKKYKEKVMMTYYDQEFYSLLIIVIGMAALNVKKKKL